MAPNPKEVFDDPDQHLGFLTASSDVDFEGQYFDRKEAGRSEAHGALSKSSLDDLLENITKTVSAFANKNVHGGLLVLGISSEGEIKGIDHLSEEQENRITNISAVLKNQSAQVKVHACADRSGFQKQVCLIFTPFCANGICETLGGSPKAWMRHGKQNLPLDQGHRDQLLRDKKIVVFERTLCCGYEPNLVDQAVLQEFKRTCADGFSGTDADFLYNLGAVERRDSELLFTNAGILFFGANPQRVLPHAYLRLLRFAATSDHRDKRGLPTFSRDFGGPLTKQIRDLRTFFKQSGFFKTYSRRNTTGGFVDDPEFPFIAVDESVVNAVAHRDYAVALPIECESYSDAFLVTNPGPVLQRNHDVPDHFSLADTVLDSAPRNSHLIEWLRRMRDEHGAAFVFALSEGTKRMRDEMANLRLPAPDYVIRAGQTCVRLFNNAQEREALLRSESATPATEFTNLFPVKIVLQGRGEVATKDITYDKKELTNGMRDAFVAKDWFVDSLRYGRLTAHRRGTQLPLPRDVAQLIRFFPAYSFQFNYFFGRLYLSIDYTLEIRNAQALNRLLSDFEPETFVDLPVIAKQHGWHRGRLLAVGQESSRLLFVEQERETQVPNDQILPQLPKRLIEVLLAKRNIRFDLHHAIKQHSLSLEPQSARIRADKTRATAEMVAASIFPIAIGPLQLILEPEPAPLQRDGADTSGFYVASLAEPTVEFSHQHESANIRDGITKFGAYQSSPKDIEVVPVCAMAFREKIAALIKRLQAGQFKYRGAERTFSTRFRYSTVVTVASPLEALSECQRLLAEHPEWIGDKDLSRVFLVHTPEADYALDDENAPYYRIKRLLLESGVPCQMVDTPTLQNPDWKDLNLALNLTAKCGVTPWVLPGAIPDADFFVGLSYTQSGRRQQQRLMGYANVFNQYGRWMFYSGSSAAFDYEARTAEFERLTKLTLERLNLSETPSIYFHYSSKFSREDRDAILRAARRVRSAGTYNFVWLNTHHNVRLYDSRPETDGSLGRGNYVKTSKSQFFLSTTGYNPFRKALGTPHMLEINTRIYRPDGAPDTLPDMKGLAMQILSLTKLNWGSTDSLCGEPITTKYAGDIAYLTAAFLRQGTPFRLHPVLEGTPWFI